MKLLQLFLFILLFCQCTKKEEKPRAVLDLIKKYQLAQEEIAAFEPKIKTAASDVGVLVQLNYEKELAKSRLESIKEKLKILSPDTLSAPIKAGSEHGGGH